MGLDNINLDPQFDFLSFFTAEDEKDLVPDSFFINNQCSPYSNINLNCTYLDIQNLTDLNKKIFSVLSFNTVLKVYLPNLWNSQI